MALLKAQKQKIIEDLKEKIQRQKIIIFCDFTGLKVKDFSDLRTKLKITGNELKVAKKTLMVISSKNFNATLAEEIKKMIGEISLVFGYQDIISAAKTVWQFSENNPNLKILGGFFEGKIRQAEEVIALAQLPSKEELLAKLMRSISAPVSNFVNVLQGNIKGLIYVLAKAKT